MFNKIGLENFRELSDEELDKWQNLLMIHRFALEEIKTKLNILNEECSMIQDCNPIGYIKTRLKKPYSIREKLLRKGYEFSVDNAMKNIQDISGVRIICSFKSDIFVVADMIKNQDDIEVVRESDYITNPKVNGYQSYHLIVKVPVFMSKRYEKVCVEIQIRTSAMDFWASLEHKINYKFNNIAPEEILEELKICAHISSELDERMYKIKQKILDE
jgi:putative GTP pyrophosphokinase